jgi:hypothetical protein
MVLPNTRFVPVVADGRLTGGIAVDTDRRRGVARGRIPGTGPLAPTTSTWSRLREPSLRCAPRCSTTSNVTIRGSRTSIGSGPTAVSSCATPWLAVPKDLERYVASRATKLREETRRVIRRLGEAGYQYRDVVPDETGRALATLERLHRKRWGGGAEGPVRWLRSEPVRI